MKSAVCVTAPLQAVSSNFGCLPTTMDHPQSTPPQIQRKKSGKKGKVFVEEKVRAKICIHACCPTIKTRFYLLQSSLLDIIEQISGKKDEERAEKLERTVNDFPFSVSCWPGLILYAFCRRKFSR